MDEASSARTDAKPVAFRTIDPDRDGALVTAWAREAFAVSFGDAWTDQHFDADGFLGFVRWGVGAFPDGFVLACQAGTAPQSHASISDDRCVGLLLLDVRDAAQAGSSDIAGAIAYAHLYYLTPAARGTGASYMLQRYADDFCRRHQVHAIELNVEPANARAVRYYTRMGYRVVRETLREGLPVLRLRKVMPPADTAPPEDV